MVAVKKSVNDGAFPVFKMIAHWASVIVATSRIVMHLDFLIFATSILFSMKSYDSSIAYME